MRIEQVDHYRQLFESGLQAGTGVQIEEFLSDHDLPFDASLVLELVKLELKHGVQPDVAGAGYADRFPQLQSQLPRLSAGQALPSTVDIGSQSSSVAPRQPVPGRTRPSIPRHIGPYQVLSLLGQGGQSVVYLGIHDQLHRQVAIKVARAPVADQRLQQKLIEEGRLLARLKDARVVTVYDLDFVDGCPYLVMEHVEGPNLAQMQRSGTCTPQRAAAIVQRIAEAVHSLHDAGILHRDLKPSNILMLKDDEPMIIDFGLSQRQSVWSADEISPSAVEGTIGYMAPEQARGEPADARADIFSIGAVLYALLTGRPPFHADSVQGALDQAKRCDYDQGALAHVPGALREVCIKAMQPRPEHRHQSAAQLADELKQRPSSQARRAGWPARLALTATALVAAGLVLAFVLAYWPWSGRTDNDRREQAADTKPPASESKSSEPRLARLQVTHLAKRGQQLQPMGALGIDSFSPALEDLVTVEAVMSQETYAFILAFAPDGSEILCFPEDENEPPPLTDRPRYPFTNRDHRYELSEGSGLHLFAVAASTEPLPSYRQWVAQRKRPSPWKQPASPESPDVVWFDDGQVIETLGRNGPVRGERGTGKKVPGLGQIVAVTDWLRDAPGIQTAGAIGFTVLPRKDQPDRQP